MVRVPRCSAPGVRRAEHGVQRADRWCWEARWRENPSQDLFKTRHTEEASPPWMS